MPAGYSGTPLPKKLGITEGTNVALVDEPPGFRDLLNDLPADVTFGDKLNAEADIVIVFATDRAALESHFFEAAKVVFPDGAIWASWPKKASKVPTDITEDTMRELALPHGLVDNKVCAVSEIWSGLRVVWRKEHRRRATSPQLPGELLVALAARPDAAKSFDGLPPSEQLRHGKHVAAAKRAETRHRRSATTIDKILAKDSE